MPPTLIKKYGNRRLYDTGESRYITLDELSAKIRGGTDVRVVDAQTGDDLTQATLVQIILETGTSSKFLPVPLLNALVRLDEDSLAEFFGRYVSAALDMYMQARRSPLATIPLSAGDALARMFMSSPLGQWTGFQPPSPSQTRGWVARDAPREPEPPPRERQRDDDIAELRRELDELKRSGLGKPGARRKKKS
jgi:polyhydroxyalkanoate synthesis repressor PhaR